MRENKQNGRLEGDEGEKLKWKREKMRRKKERKKWGRQEKDEDKEEGNWS